MPALTPTAASTNDPPLLPYAAGVAPEATRLRDLTPAQKKSGLAAWLGWLFDGLDMHLYTLVAAPFVAALLHASSTSSGDVKEKSAIIQAAFLVGWAVGGGLFGRIGDRLGRSRALALTILTYAVFTGLAFFVTEWWQLMICRFLAALGIGGEWAVGSSLLSETWPKRWRAWIAAVLQTGVNFGVMAACVAYYVLADGTTLRLLRNVWHELPQDFHLRAVFLVGILPAVMVFWIRRHVPEPEAWTAAKMDRIGMPAPRMTDLFRGDVRRTTLLTVAVCACSLTGWWAFMFWHVQHLRSLPDVATWTDEDKNKLVSAAFFVVIGVSIFGNFFAAAVARRLGYRRAIAILCLMFGVAVATAYYKERSYAELLPFLAAIGFCSGVFGLFTMYLPPLFPTLLRTTGAGFGFNVGRLAAAAGTVVFALGLAKVDLRTALLCDALLFLPAAVIVLWMPDLRDEGSAGAAKQTAK